MKYILGICNAVAVAVLAYIILLTSNQLSSLDKTLQANINKYKTENAAEIAYVTEVYHLGDWSTILADSMAVQNQLGISDETRVRAAQQIGAAISFEETLCSYLVAFEDGLTTIVKPYELISNNKYSLLTDISFESGTLINYTSGATISIDTQTELIAAYREVRNLSSALSDDAVLQAMKYDRTIFVNDIIDEAMGKTANGQQDRVYIPAVADNRPKINLIDNQTIMVLSSADTAQSTTTLAAYTKQPKRMWCEIQGQHGIFYCYSDELPPGYAIRATYNNEYQAAETSKGRYYKSKQN